ncbi:hypothetical protein LOK49_LG04G00778 [Camellia lanceoleosa]|uniref:Uncharacterized protein n=1 Tax=Camellia lanceoleosa TaxID=1840588 RepID=A0ACC0HXM5_9ERIC|nr:hypothetical protein LOK49_LG04G00778 [Camellia lanceoleosa]
MTRVGFDNYPHLQVRKSPEFENLVPDTSPLASRHSLDIGVRSVNRSLYSYGHSGRSSDDHYIQILPEFEENFVPNDTSPQLLAGASVFIRSNSGQSWDMIEEKTKELWRIYVGKFDA